MKVFVGSEIFDISICERKSTPVNFKSQLVLKSETSILIFLISLYYATDGKLRLLLLSKIIKNSKKS